MDFAFTSSSLWKNVQTLPPRSPAATFKLSLCSFSPQACDGRWFNLLVGVNYGCMGREVSTFLSGINTVSLSKRYTSDAQIPSLGRPEVKLKIEPRVKNKHLCILFHCIVLYCKMQNDTEVPHSL